MRNKPIVYTPIGMIRTGHVRAEKTPIQTVFARGCRGRAEVFPSYAEGLRDLEGFSHIFLIYHFHRAKQTGLTVKPFFQDVERGVFATRASGRPNAIGLSLVRLIKRDGRVLHLDGADMLDGTPLLDIKPFVSRFERITSVRDGWQEQVDEQTARRRGQRMSGEAKR